MTDEHKSINYNRFFDLVLFAMSGALIGGFLYLKQFEAAKAMGSALIGAATMYLKGNH